MRTLLSTAGAVALTVALAATASAQVGATFVLRSGEKISGELVDMNARGLVATVGGAERAWPVSEVAVVDFVGGGNNLPSNEINQAGSGHLLVLRNGQVMSGQLYDIGGRRPLRITFSTGGGNRDFSSDEVARLYFSRPANAGNSTNNQNSNQNGNGNQNGDRNRFGQDSGGNSVTVSAREGWTSTGLRVRQGDVIHITSSGEIRFTSDPNDVASTAGSKAGRYVRNAPMPRALAGALIGRINNGDPFGIGDQRSFTAPESGTLYLGVNDDNLSDNSGEFQVKVSLEGQNQYQNPTDNPNRPHRRRPN